MKKLTRTIAAVSALAMSVGALSACGGSNVNADKGHVYFLSMKVEQQDQFKELAEKFTKKTGIQVDIATASSDTYEQSLKSELAKSEAPTLFDVDNNDFLNWTDYYADMSGTNIYKDQENPDYALKDGDTVGAVPYVMERYGIIYNKKLLQGISDELIEAAKLDGASETRIFHSIILPMSHNTIAALAISRSCGTGKTTCGRSL